MPFQFTNYEPRYTTQIADLIGAPGRAGVARADVEAQRLADRGRAKIGTANALATTGMQLLAFPETQKIERINAAKLATEDDDAQDQMAIRAATQKYGTDVEAITKDLQATRPTAAVKFTTAEQEKRTKRIQQAKATTDAAMGLVSQSSQILQGVNAVPPEQRPAAYARARQQILGLFPADAHQDIPEQFDQGYVDQAIAEGRTAAQQLDFLQASNRALELAHTTSQDARQQDQYYTEAAAKLYQTVDDQEELDKARETLRQNGVSEAILKKFPTKYTESTKADAAKFLPASEANAYGRQNRAGTFEGFLDDYAKALGLKDASALSAAQQLTAKAKWDSAGQKPTADPNAISTAQKAEAERWKASQLSALETRYRTSQAGGINPITDQPIVPMTAQQLEAEKSRIQDSYLAQIGLPPAKAPTAASTPKPSKTASTGVTSAIRSRVKDILTEHGYASDDEAVDTFLKNPTNRQALGLP